MRLPIFDETIIRSIENVGRIRNKTNLFESLFATFTDYSEQMLLEMDTALQKQEKEALEAYIHRIKGSAGTLGAARLAGVCEDLEDLLRNKNISWDRVSEILNYLKKTYSDTATQAKKMFKT